MHKFHNGISEILAIHPQRITQPAQTTLPPGHSKSKENKKKKKKW
jgi:hypothetical protein